MTQRFTVLGTAALILGIAAGLLLGDVPPRVAAQPKLARPVALSAAVRPPATRRPAVRPVPKPAQIRIPAIGVRAAVRPVGLNADGSMEVPEFGFAGWYTKGPRPGAQGPAVVVAHVDSYKGPDVFFRLRELKPGNRIVIGRRDGSSAAWRVTSLEQVDKDDLPVARIWNRTTRPVLRLVTCGGDFDRNRGHYRDNVIVYAAPEKP